MPTTKENQKPVIPAFINLSDINHANELSEQLQQAGWDKHAKLRIGFNDKQEKILYKSGDSKLLDANGLLVRDKNRNRDHRIDDVHAALKDILSPVSFEHLLLATNSDKKSDYAIVRRDQPKSVTVDLLMKLVRTPSSYLSRRMHQIEKIRSITGEDVNTHFLEYLNDDNLSKLSNLKVFNAKQILQNIGNIVNAANFDNPALNYLSRRSSINQLVKTLLTEKNQALAVSPSDNLFSKYVSQLNLGQQIKHVSDSEQKAYFSDFLKAHCPDYTLLSVKRAEHDSILLHVKKGNQLYYVKLPYSDKEYRCLYDQAAVDQVVYPNLSSSDSFTEIPFKDSHMLIMADKGQSYGRAFHPKSSIDRMALVCESVKQLNKNFYQKKQIHGDLSCHNIVVDEQDNVTIIDPLARQEDRPFYEQLMIDIERLPELFALPNKAGKFNISHKDDKSTAYQPAFIYMQDAAQAYRDRLNYEKQRLELTDEPIDTTDQLNTVATKFVQEIQDRMALELLILKVFDHSTKNKANDKVLSSVVELLNGSDEITKDAITRIEANAKLLDKASTTSQLCLPLLHLLKKDIERIKYDTIVQSSNENVAINLVEQSATDTQEQVALR